MDNEETPELYLRIRKEIAIAVQAHGVSELNAEVLDACAEVLYDMHQVEE